MPTYITKQIPVAKHVKKFLVYTYGKSYEFSKNDFLGKLLLSVFEKGYRKTQLIQCKESYTVKIHDRQLELMGEKIEWSNTVYLNKGIDDVFRTFLFLNIDMFRKILRGNSHQYLAQCLHEMNITEEDINFESLYRDYLRKKKYKKTNYKEISFNSDVA